MTATTGLWLVPALVVLAWLGQRAWRRLELSRAKHPSLAGHARWSRRLAGLLPFYSYDERQFFACDGAPAAVSAARRAAFERLATAFRSQAPASVAYGDSLTSGLSDVQFTDAYRVPFQFRDYVREHLRGGAVVDASRGVELRDLDR